MATQNNRFVKESTSEFIQRQREKLKARREGREDVASQLQKVRGSKAVQNILKFKDIKVSDPEIVEVTRRIKTDTGEIIEGFTRADIVKRKALRNKIENLNREVSRLTDEASKKPIVVGLEKRGKDVVTKLKEKEKKLDSYINRLKKTDAGKKTGVFIKKQKEKFKGIFDKFDEKRRKIARENLASTITEKQKLEKKGKLSYLEKKRLKNLKFNIETRKTLFEDTPEGDKWKTKVKKEIIKAIEEPVISSQAFLKLNNNERRALVVGGVASIPGIARDAKNKIKKEVVDFAEADFEGKKQKLRNVASAVVEGAKDPRNVAEGIIATTTLFIGVFGKKIANRLIKEITGKTKKELAKDLSKELAKKKRAKASTKTVINRINNELADIKAKKKGDSLKFIDEKKLDIKAKKKELADIRKQTNKTVRLKRKALRKKSLKRRFVDALDEFDFDRDDDDDDDDDKKKDDDDDDDDDDKQRKQKRKLPLRVKPKFKPRIKLKARIKARAKVRVRPKLKLKPILPLIIIKKKVSKPKKVIKKKKGKTKELIKFTPTLFSTTKKKKKSKQLVFIGFEER